jgi:hypothetical protein
METKWQQIHTEEPLNFTVSRRTLTKPRLFPVTRETT